ncbi:MerR-type HTH domain [Syntrophomonas zehnderi OL-4]|uniref:MerR-type HTH domain n=1 Tax=Syntrophomonas zehnderi OL-4 TaxID=690567 RepID=A0A0E4C8S4_9FIRM|nr:MerR family transcriptional regulator [Syntrophomonas zehnderi]CFX68497.1 MerR-type HTH domain [Syntrophomonas zehnderi OL-4]
MHDIYYKIGEVSDMLGIEPYTLRYLESTLKLKIRRDERGERLYSDADLDTLRLILQLKNEKGLNTTAIKLALENLNENSDSPNASPQVYNHVDFVEIFTVARTIMQQNDEILVQNKQMQERLQELEKKMSAAEQKREEKITELIALIKYDSEDKKPGWLAKLMRK